MSSCPPLHQKQELLNRKMRNRAFSSFDGKSEEFGKWCKTCCLVWGQTFSVRLSEENLTSMFCLFFCGGVVFHLFVGCFGFCCCWLRFVFSGLVCASVAYLEQSVCIERHESFSTCISFWLLPCTRVEATHGFAGGALLRCLAGALSSGAGVADACGRLESSRK